MAGQAGSARAFAIMARIGAATIGGYGFSYAAAAFLSRIMPMARSETVIATAFVAIALHLAIALWAFGSRSIARTWMVLLAGGLALYASAFWLPLWAPGGLPAEGARLGQAGSGWEQARSDDRARAPITPGTR